MIATATLFNSTGNYPKALELFLEALKKFEQINNQEGIARALGSIGTVYIHQGEHRQGLDYTLRAKSIVESLHDDFYMGIAFVNLGEIYEKLNQLDSARIYTQQAYELAIKLNDIEGIGIALNTLGNIYAKMNQPIIALEFYRSALPYHIKANSNDYICENSLGMARLFQQMGQTDSSLHYAHLSLVTAKNVGFVNYELNATSFLTDYYKRANNVDSAFAYQSATIAAKDSLFSQEKVKQIQQLSFEETLRQEELEAQRQAAAEDCNIIFSTPPLLLLLSCSLPCSYC